MEQWNALKIGFIGGGKMAAAIIQGILSGKQIPARNILVTDTGTERLEYLKETFGVDGIPNDERTNRGAIAVAEQSDLVLIAVKPQVARPVLDAISTAVGSNTVAVSIMAGVTLETLESRLPAAVVRVMPTISMAQQKGISAIVAGTRCSAAQLGIVRQLFGLAGDTYLVPENKLDAVTALSGCGIAYAMMFIEAMADAGVAAGIQRADAYKIAAQMVSGAGSMVLAGGHPAALKDDVCSPGGATIVGVRALENGAFRATVMDAVNAAVERLDEMRAIE